MLAFADDIALVANDYQQAQEMMNTLETVLRRYSLQLNINKTQYIANQAGRILYEGNEIERTNKYKYLGKIIEEDLSHKEHINKQLIKAEKTNAQLVPFMLRGGGITPNMSKNLIVGAMQA